LTAGNRKIEWGPCRYRYYPKWRDRRWQ